jgi:hypothetical protein
MSEVWIPIAGYEGLYEVSSAGTVRSKDRLDSIGRAARGLLLRPETRPSGHLRVTLCRDGKTRRLWVHRLVLEAFVGPRPAGMEACHNDGNPVNNVPSNLRWDTKSANAQDRVRHGGDWHARRTHCGHGHELTPENIYWEQGGTSRRCRVCALAWQKAKRDAQRELKRAA